MTAYASFTQELNCEKVHTALKRAIERSNNCNSYLKAMKNAVIHDRHGRLSLIPSPMLYDEGQSDVRFAIRVLAERHAVWDLSSPINHTVITTQNNIMLGTGRSPTDILRPGNTILPSRAIIDEIARMKCRIGRRKWNMCESPPCTLPTIMEEDLRRNALTYYEFQSVTQLPPNYFVPSIAKGGSTYRTGSVIQQFQFPPNTTGSVTEEELLNVKISLWHISLI